MDLRRDTIEEIIEMLQEMRDSGTRMRSESLLEVIPTSTHRPKLLLAVGHSRAGDSGAESYDGSSNEWQYNQELAAIIASQLSQDIDVTIIDQYQGSSYSTAMQYLKTTANVIKPNLVVELHFNSFSNQRAKGFETLYWHNSTKGKTAADSLQSSLKAHFPNNINRGSKPITSKKQRGAGFLRTLQPPCVILEPFFASNPSEWQMFRTEDGKNRLAKAITQGLEECLLD